MSVEIVKNDWYQVLICNTTMVAFGDVFHASEDVEAFLNWLPQDARRYSQKELSEKISEWRKIVAEEIEAASRDDYYVRYERAYLSGE